jgi:hypothetical protein
MRFHSRHLASDRGGAGKEGALFNVEPAVGSTPPWAGVTPAPSGEDKRRCGTSSLLELMAQKGLSSHPSF